MSTAVENDTTFTRRPEDAATIALMLMKACIIGLTDGDAMAEVDPHPVLIDGAAVSAFELA